MKLEDLEIGGIYENDNGSVVYKIVEITNTWVLAIIYKAVHNIATVEFWNTNNFKLYNIQGVKDYDLLRYYKMLFDCKFIVQDNQTLILK